MTPAHPTDPSPAAASPDSLPGSSFSTPGSGPDARADADLSTDKAARPSSGRELVVCAADCYWAVLDASSLDRPLLGRASARSKQLGYLFETQLPVAIESVQSVFLTLAEATPAGQREARSGQRGRERVLACGIDRQRLAALSGVDANAPASGGDDGGAVALYPSEVPAELEAGGVEPRELNLLVGDFEPPALRCARRRWPFQLAVIVIVCGATFVAGLERRVMATAGREAAAREAITAVYRQVLPPEPAAGTQPDALRLTAELRRLRMTRQDPSPALDGPDAVDTIASLLAAWPSGDARLRIQTELVTATANGATVRVVVPDHEQAQALQAALEHTPGFKAGPPQIATQRDAVRMDCRLVRETRP